MAPKQARNSRLRQSRAAPGAVGTTGRTEPTGVDPRWLSQTIGTIYDCVLNPQNWREVIAAVAAEFEFVNGTLAVFQLSPGLQQVVVQHGIDAEWLASAEQYSADTVKMWGGQAQIDAFPLDELIQATAITPISELAAFGYYRDILAPRGLVDAVVVMLGRDAGVMGYLAFNRHRDARTLGPREMDGLRLLAPHFRRAVTISNLFDLKAVEGATFRSVLDAINCAVVLVDETLGVVHANPAAEAMLTGHHAIEIVEGKLRVAGRPAHDALQSAVQLCAADEALLGQRGIGIPVRAEGKAPGILHVMPLRRRGLEGGMTQRAVAAVFVVPAGRSETPVDAIALLYDLTPAEGKIFAGIAQGRTLKDTAKALGIAKSTARTHLLRIFEKTGCKRQAELVALTAQLSLHI